jgi:hypothetical protein
LSQYFGSGKTTLGKMFPVKIKDKAVIDFFEGKLQERANSELVDEWEKIQHEGINHVLIDARNVNDIVLEAVRVASNNSQLDNIRDSKQAAGILVDYAIKNGPTLLHFDEVGSRAKHNLDELRQLAVAVWSQMCKMPNKAPPIYFFVTGKSTEPFERIGSGSSVSGSRFLVLDMLATEHVNTLRRHLQSSDEIKCKLELEQLNEEENGGYLDQLLVCATGGAPRLLLYTLRVLHHTQAPLSSPEHIKKAVLETVFSELNKINVIRGEFLPHTESGPQSALVFAHLLALSIHQIELTIDTKVMFNGKEHSVGEMLKFQPFFLSRDGNTALDHFVLHLPRYHMRAAEKRFRTDGLPMLLLAMAGGSSLRASTAWRFFELLPAQLIASMQATLTTVKRQETGRPSWSLVLPDLLGKSEIAKHAAFSLGLEPFNWHYAEGRCPGVIEENPQKYIEIDGCVMPGDKSSSADLFHVQKRLDNGYPVLIQWQAKFYLQTGLQMATVRDEVGKSAVSLESVLIIYSANVSEQLTKAMRRIAKPSAHTDKLVLTLRSWDDTSAAEFGFNTEGLLLWRPKKRHEDVWFEFPAKEQQSKSKSRPGKNSAVLEVRVGLEVVIPHQDLVRELVGARLFDSLVAFEKEGSTSSAVGAVITTLDEVLHRSSSSPAERGEGGKLKQSQEKNLSILLSPLSMFF